jgi:hypothetical protein
MCAVGDGEGNLEKSSGEEEGRGKEGKLGSRGLDWKI